MWVLGYYSGWNSNLYPVGEIDWGGLTHIVTAFHVPNAQGTSLDDSQAGGPQLIQSVIAAAHSAGKRAIASIGGTGAGSAFSGATSSANLAGFVGVLQKLVTMYGYDGLDIDWEDSIDNTLLQNFLKALRQAMPNIAITMPVVTQNNNLAGDLSVFGTVSQYVDRINIMSYGMSGTWDGWKSWHSSPLHWNNDNATPVAIDSSVDDYMKAGVPAAKLGLGSGFYGQCYTSPVTAPDQALGGSTIAADEASMSYPYIMSTYYSANAHNWDTGAMVPYLTFASAHSPDGCTYISYEDAQSIAAKGAYAKSKALGGIIIWTINLGYVSSAPAGQRSPLLDAMKTAFLQ
jgi:chitinase